MNFRQRREIGRKPLNYRDPNHRSEEHFFWVAEYPYNLVHKKVTLNGGPLGESRGVRAIRIESPRMGSRREDPQGVIRTPCALTLLAS